MQAAFLVCSSCDARLFLHIIYIVDGIFRCMTALYFLLLWVKWDRLKKGENSHTPIPTFGLFFESSCTGWRRESTHIPQDQMVHPPGPIYKSMVFPNRLNILLWLVRLFHVTCFYLGEQGFSLQVIKTSVASKRRPFARAPSTGADVNEEAPRVNNEYLCSHTCFSSGFEFHWDQHSSW